MVGCLVEGCSPNLVVNPPNDYRLESLTKANIFMFVKSGFHP